MPVSEDSGVRDLSLPPTNELGWEQFEDFTTEAVLSAHRFANRSGRRIARVSRWGRRGDKQNGIDFEGEWSDGTTSSWQCKAYDRLQPADVRSAIEACSFDADTHHLVYSGLASPAVRQEIQKYADWTLIDRRDSVSYLQTCLFTVDARSSTQHGTAPQLNGSSACREPTPSTEGDQPP